MQHRKMSGKEVTACIRAVFDKSSPAQLGATSIAESESSCRPPLPAALVCRGNARMFYRTGSRWAGARVCLLRGGAGSPVSSKVTSRATRREGFFSDRELIRAFCLPSTSSELSARPISKRKIVRAAESNELLRIEADRFKDHTLCFRLSHMALNIFLPLIKCRVKFVPVIHDGPKPLIILANSEREKNAAQRSLLKLSEWQPSRRSRARGAQFPRRISDRARAAAPPTPSSARAPRRRLCGRDTCSSVDRHPSGRVNSPVSALTMWS